METGDRAETGNRSGKALTWEKNKREAGRHKKRPRRAIDTILVVVVLLCGILLAGNILKETAQRKREEEIRKLAVQEEKAPAGALRDGETQNPADMDPEEPGEYHSPVDFESLRAVNPDIVAWIEIPGTDISYPVVQADDNETYLKRDFEGNTSAAGAIFLDCDSSGDLMGLHSILYGHHMKNQTMFAQIVKFKDESFFRKNREVILYLPESELHLRTIAAVYGDADGEKRRTEFSSRERFNLYVDEMTKNCSFRELPEGDVEGLYSFVTCSYEFDDARTILYAVRGQEGENGAEDGKN